MRRFIFLFVFLFALTSLRAQINFLRYDSIEVYANSQQLAFPWAGGINFAQFSEIDFDQDGIQDLFVFDRTGNKITTYLNLGTANQVDYVLAPQYVAQFPLLHDWVLLRDYNCDGKMDIFTSFGSLNPGIAVWKNTSTGPNLQFQLVTQALLSDVTPNSTHIFDEIFIAPFDVPAIRDLDQDGDLDVLVFDNSGVYIQMHQNMSMEVFGICDSLQFQLNSQCWGEFVENTLNSTLTLNSPCSAPPIIQNENQNLRSNLHNGSCLECINTDGDTDQDILVGDLSNHNIVFGRNDSTINFSHVDSIDTQYPSYGQPVYMSLFVCAYHLDVNNDGKKDLIFTPNASNTSENYYSVSYYQNTGANDSVRVSYVTRNFLQADMIETGQGAYPRFFDYDSDGDQDLFIGNNGYFSDTSAYPAKIALYKNIGSQAFPTYNLVTDDFANIYAQQLNFLTPIPCFGDLDGDGDEDMLVGTGNGKIHFFRKDPGPADNFVLAQANYMNIDVGNFAAPQLVDVDRDGLIDLIIGEETGNINYYRNTGTASLPNFALVNGLWGNVLVQQIGFSTGHSVPFLWDNNGAYTLLVGSERGYLYRYDNIDGNLSGNFTLTDSMYVSTHEGTRIAPWLADITNDTLPELVLGNFAGGVSLFKGTIPSGASEMETAPLFELFPNPTNDVIHIRSSTETEFLAEYIVYDISGKELLRQNIQTVSYDLPVQALSPGMYLLAVRMNDGRYAFRSFVKN
jgi:Secretion system C-terminal sorting domain/FG-GAP-like repeat